MLAVDKIFASTRKLTGDAIVDFVKAICSISHEELIQNPPRMYSLSKIVDVAYYNMDRVRYEWTHVWAVMGEHFNKAGCMNNSEVAIFAVDALRQLSTVSYSLYILCPTALDTTPYSYSPLLTQSYCSITNLAIARNFWIRVS